MAELQNYRFRASSQITRVDRIQVKMTGEIPHNEIEGVMVTIDGWTTVYQREQPPGEAGSADVWAGPYPRWKPGVKAGKGPPAWVNGVLIKADESLLNKGEVELPFEVAKQGGQRENRINEARMDGVFNNPKNRNIKDGANYDPSKPEEFVTTADIIAGIMEKYAGVPYDKRKYHAVKDENGVDVLEIEKELAPLNKHEIGILFDKSISVYEAIEKLQSGSVTGFQFYCHEDKYTARLDDPERKPDPDIHSLEILNLDEVEIDWNADLYGSYTNVGYEYNYSEKDGRRWIDRTKQGEILDIHRVEKEWKADTLLAEKESAKLKSDKLLEDFKKLRPIIKNIKLAGEKWLDLRMYDIRYIDFRVPGEEKYQCPRHLVRLIEEAGNERVVSLGKTDEYITLIDDETEKQGGREFAGKVRCQILRIGYDTGSGITTIDVRGLGG